MTDLDILGFNSDTDLDILGDLAHLQPQVPDAKEVLNRGGWQADEPDQQVRHRQVHQEDVGGTAHARVPPHREADQAVSAQPDDEDDDKEDDEEPLEHEGGDGLLGVVDVICDVGGQRLCVRGQEIHGVRVAVAVANEDLFLLLKLLVVVVTIVLVVVVVVLEERVGEVEDKCSIKGRPHPSLAFIVVVIFIVVRCVHGDGTNLKRGLSHFDGSCSTCRGIKNKDAF